MIGLVVAVLSVLLPLLHVAVSTVPRSPSRVIHLLLLYALVLDVGVIGLVFGFIPHVFFPDEAAQLIGWQPVPVRGWGSRRCMGASGLPEYFDWRLILVRNRSRMVTFHAWGDLRSRVPNVA